MESSTKTFIDNVMESDIDIVKEEIPLSDAANKIAIDTLAKKMREKERKLEGEISLTVYFWYRSPYFNYVFEKYWCSCM